MTYKFIDELKIAMTTDRLKEAEAEYLIAHGWVRHVGAYRNRSGRSEDLWTLPRPEYVLSRKYQEIPQGHAINAQKAMAAISGYWTKPR